MPSENKVQAVKELKKEAKEYPVIGLLDMHKLPGKQLHEIRDKLRGQAKIKMWKRVVIERAFGSSQELKELTGYITGQPAILFSKENPFKLARTIMESKSKAAAKAGDIAPSDITVKEGPTSLPPGPVIGELQRAKIPAFIDGDKIAIRKDTVVVKAGEPVLKPVAEILSKLGIEPIEIGLTLIAAWDSGTIYPKDVLFIPQEEYIGKIGAASHNALNLSVFIGLPTRDNIRALISKANSHARGLAEKSGFLTSDTVRPILAKADTVAQHLKGRLKLESTAKVNDGTESK